MNVSTTTKLQKDKEESQVELQQSQFCSHKQSISTQTVYFKFPLLPNWYTFYFPVVVKL
jgi:hypothetical protein